MAKQLLGTQTTDENGVATFTLTGTGRGKLNLIAESGGLVSQPVIVEDALFYDVCGTDSSLSYYSVYSPNAKSYDNSGIKVTGTSNNAYIRLNIYENSSEPKLNFLNSIKGKTITLKAYVYDFNCTSVKAMIYDKTADTNYSGTTGDITTENGVITCTREIREDITNAFCQLQIQAGSNNDYFHFKNFEVIISG